MIYFFVANNDISQNLEEYWLYDIGLLLTKLRSCHSHNTAGRMHFIFTAKKKTKQIRLYHSDVSM